MKKVNFANAAPAASYRELRLWMMITGAVLSIGIGTFAFLNLIQLPELYHTYTACTELRTLAQHAEKTNPEQTALKAEHESLTRRLAKIHKRQRDPKDPIPFLQLIQQVNAQSLNIERFHVGKQTVDLTATSANPRTITQFAERLSKLPMVAHAEVSTIQQRDAEQSGLPFTCIIKGQLVSKSKKPTA